MTESQAPTLDPARDIALIDAGAFARRPCPATTTPRGDGFEVVFTRFALEAIHTHGKSSLDAEICGVLVGQPLQDEHGPYLLIHAAVEGDSARNHAAQVTFTAETWAHIQEVMDNKYPDDRIVGWYHTHPGFGIFLSGMDLFIQDNFFNLPWQVAFVYDPKQEQEGLFTWQGGVASPAPFLVRDDAAEEMGEGKREEEASGDLRSADLRPADLRSAQGGQSARGGQGSGHAEGALASHQQPATGNSSDTFSAAFPAVSLDEFAARLLTLERRQRFSDATLQHRIEALERRNRWLVVALAFTISFVVAWTLVIMPLFPEANRGVRSGQPTTAPIGHEAADAAGSVIP